MRYLDYDKHDQIVQQYYGNDFTNRAVGANRQFDSGYIDIVRFFGPSAVNPSDVSIQYDSQPFVFSDPIIAEFAAEVAQLMRSEGRLYDGPLVTRLKSASIIGKRKLLSVQPAEYAQLAGSCLALDMEHPLFARSGRTLRSYWKSHHSDTSLEGNPLPVCLGVCGFLLIHAPDGPAQILCQRRSAKVSSLESSVGTSVAGLVDWNSSCGTLADMITYAMNQEIAEEIGLVPGEFDLIPLAYARELFRGERPQIFCLVTSKLSTQEIDSRIRALTPHHVEHESSYWISFGNPDIVRREAFNHETRMNYYLLEEYLAEKRR